MYVILAKAFLIGFILSVPIGPVNILCIRRTLLKGQLAGFISGLGAATADAVYGFAAVVGLSAIISFLVREETAFRWIGSLFFVALGLKTFFSPTNYSASSEEDKGLFRSYISALLITLANPLTILSILAVSASVRLTGPDAGFSSIITAVLGIFLGATLWWLFLSTLVSQFNKKITPEKIRTINRISGLLMVVTGLGSLLFNL